MVTKRIDTILAKHEQVKDQDLSFERRIVDNMIRDLEQTRDLSQCICHVDMDAFYASVEELENPKLKTQPMAVGGMSMLCTSNYEARKYGVRSAMPGFIALKLCPQLKMIPLHFPKYISASNKVRAIFAKYDPNFMPMSLDEVSKKNKEVRSNMCTPGLLKLDGGKLICRVKWIILIQNTL